MGVFGEREVLWKGAKFDFERVAFHGAGGQVIHREVVRHPGAVCILPLFDAPGRPAEVVLIRNFRISLGKELWELPAGTLEPPESPEVCAARELLEETGYRAGRIESLGAFYTTPGMTDELMHAFIARDLQPGDQDLQEDEQIQRAVVPLKKVMEMIDQGELMDAKTVVTLTLAARKGLLGVGPGSVAR